MAEDRYNIPTGYNSDLVQQALNWGDKAVDQQRTAATNVINNAEAGMYEMLGRMQLQAERDIADRRMRALRTGQTSSGLAALEMQNIQVGQIGAQQVMTDARDKRLLMEQELAGTKENNRYYMLEMLNQNMKDKSAIDAQKFSASAITQAQELLGPDVPVDIISAFVKNIQGLELTDEEQTAMKNYRAGNASAGASTYTAVLGSNFDEGEMFGGNTPMSKHDMWVKAGKPGPSFGMPGKDFKQAWEDYLSDYNAKNGTSYEKKAGRTGYKD